MTTFKLLDQAECGKRIDALRTTGASLQTEIHLIACSALAHIRDHRDWTLFTRALDALPKGVRVNALAFWGGHFSNKAIAFSYDKTAGAWKGKFAKGWTPEMFDIEGACGTTFADLLPERSYDSLGILAIMAMLKRKSNDTGNHPDGKPRVDPRAREFCATLFRYGTEQLVSTPVAPTA